MQKINFGVLLLSSFIFLGMCPIDEPETEINAELLLQLVNSHRASGCKCGSEKKHGRTTPLVWNTTLEQAAQAHSDDMYAKKFLRHSGSDGSSAGARLKRFGYTWKTCGENISQGHTTEEGVIIGWMNSPGHCRNIMNPAFKEIGVARKGDYWTMVLGAR